MSPLDPLASIHLGSTRALPGSPLWKNRYAFRCITLQTSLRCKICVSKGWMSLIDFLVRGYSSKQLWIWSSLKYLNRWMFQEFVTKMGKHWQNVFMEEGLLPLQEDNIFPTPSKILATLTRVEVKFLQERHPQQTLPSSKKAWRLSYPWMRTC